MEEATPLFSFVMPLYNNEKTVSRAIRSILKQTYSNWELKIVNDCSIDNSLEEAMKFNKDRRIKIFSFEENSQRLIARNAGMRMSKPESWVIWMDADDELLSSYLETLVDYMERYPDYGIYNYGTIVIDREIIDGKRYDKGVRLRKTFEPAIKGKGHEHFMSGQIGTGSFCFKKELLKEVGYLPETSHFDEFSKIANIEGYENGAPMGNPWGDDYYMFYKLTREHQSKPLDFAPYVNYIRE